MKVKNMFWGLMAAAWALTACTQEELVGDQSVQQENTVLTDITATMQDYEPVQSSRLAYVEYMRDHFAFVWDKNDKIGIYYQPQSGVVTSAKFEIEDPGEVNSTTGVFSNIGFNLKGGETYYALYPYVEKESLTMISGAVYLPTFQTADKWQIQTGNGSTTHLGNYHYMMGILQTDANGKGKVEFTNLGALVQFNIKAIPYKRFTNLYIEYPNKTPASGYLASFGSGELAYVTTTSKDVTRLRLQLGKSGFKLDWKGDLTTYMMMASQYDQAKMVVKLEDDHGRIYSQTLENVDAIENGKMYTFDLDDFTLEGLEGNTLNGYQFVDMGTEGLDGKRIYWATRNVGATADNHPGDYFAWGETVSHCIESGYNGWTFQPEYFSGYSAANYKWYLYDNPNSGILKYDGDDVTRNLDPEDDAATVHFGNGWRMPNMVDWTALVNKCYWVWTDSYQGSSYYPGYIVYKATNSDDKGKVSSPSNPYTPSGTYSVSRSTHIFLPANGYYDGTQRKNLSGAYYWVNNGGGEIAYGYSDEIRSINGFARYLGMLIRPIYSPDD